MGRVVSSLCMEFVAAPPYSFLPTHHHRLAVPLAHTSFKHGHVSLPEVTGAHHCIELSANGGDGLHIVNGIVLATGQCQEGAILSRGIRGVLQTIDIRGNKLPCEMWAFGHHLWEGGTINLCKCEGGLEYQSINARKKGKSTYLIATSPSRAVEWVGWDGGVGRGG